MHILIAPNAFKNSLGAVEAAQAIAEGLRASLFTGSCSMCPVGDGGDGTGALLLHHGAGVRVPATVQDPLGRAIDSHFGLIDGGRTGIVELADASGLRLLADDERDPLRAHTAGTGELIARCLDRGVQDIVLCVGGSATVDAGTGLLQALGFSFHDADDSVLASLPASLIDLARIDTTRVDRRLADCTLTVVCDVVNPLVGDRGAAPVFGPQKGATPAGVRLLEAALVRFSRVVFEQTGQQIASLRHGGAAGGVAAGLCGLVGAKLVSGIDYFLSRVDFDGALEKADLVITGEGRIDEQTPQGKAPWGVAVRARRRSVFVVALAGQVPLAPSPLLRANFDALVPIGNRAMNLAEAIGCTAANLRRSGFELGNILAMGHSLASRGGHQTLSG